MGLSGEIRALRDRTLADLNSAHDYYMDTRIAWRLVRKVVAAGPTFANRNTATGTVTTETQLAARAKVYVAGQLAESTFQQFLSIFEGFYSDFLRLWLTAYPQSLGRKMVDFRTILELPDKEAVTQLVVGKELNEVLYGRPAEWFAYLEEKTGLGRPSADEVERIAEAKATRDVLVHNRGVANRTYEAKAGRRARFKEGERIDIPEPYHRATWTLLRTVAADIADAAIAKIP